METKLGTSSRLVADTFVERVIREGTASVEVLEIGLCSEMKIWQGSVESVNVGDSVAFFLVFRVP